MQVSLSEKVENSMRILVTVLLIVGAHFGLTALIPGPKALVYWPFGPESRPIIGVGAGAPTQLLAVIAGASLLAAAAALFGLIIPEGWFVPLVIVGSITSILLYVLYFSVYSIAPIAIDVILLWGVLAQQWTVASLNG
jgi:hypothetical protein